MCLLWILLQLAVVFMYWDIPPLERGEVGQSSAGRGEEVEGGSGPVEGDKDEEGDDDEGKPLMGPHELLGSYGSVGTPDPPRKHVSTVSNGNLSHISPPPSPPPQEAEESSSPFKNFSIRRGRLWFIPGYLQAHRGAVHSEMKILSVVPYPCRRGSLEF